MPRKRPIRTGIELSQRLGKEYSRQDKSFRKAINRPAVAALAAERAFSYIEALKLAPFNKRHRLLGEMPSYETLVEKSDIELKGHRQSLAQTARAEKARKALHRIGPPTCQGLTLPPGVQPPRLPLTIDAFVEEFIRSAMGAKVTARQMWTRLPTALKAIGALVTDDKNDLHPRRDAYDIAIDGRTERTTFGQFQKILSRVRESRKALG